MDPILQEPIEARMPGLTDFSRSYPHAYPVQRAQGTNNNQIFIKCILDARKFTLFEVTLIYR